MEVEDSTLVIDHEPRKDRKVPRDLQLKLELNVVDQDTPLLGRIRLIQAKLDILEEIIELYEELNQKLTILPTYETNSDQ